MSFCLKLFQFSEAKAIERWKLCIIPFFSVIIWRMVTSQILEIRLIYLVSAFVLCLMYYALTTRKVKFYVYQWIAFIVTFGTLYARRDLTRSLYPHWTKLTAFTWSHLPFLPSFALLYMSGGVPGFLLIVVDFVYLIHCFLDGEINTETMEQFSITMYGLIAQTLLGYVWLMFEESTEKKLRVLLEKEQASNAAKTTFVAWLSHDLRTPLVGLVGFLEELRETPPSLSTAQSQIVSKLQFCVDSMNGLLTNLLDFAALDTGSLIMKQNIFNLHNCLYGQCTVLQAIASKKKIELRLTAESEDSDQSEILNLPFVRGDNFRLEQVLTNLVNNAMKFSNAFTTINITCRYKIERSIANQLINNTTNATKNGISHSLSNNNRITNSNGNSNNTNNHNNNNNNSSHNNINNTPNSKKGSDSIRQSSSEDFLKRYPYGCIVLEIIVEDQGIGIAPKHLPFIFDSFYQVVRGSQHGSGLGLFIVRELVSAMGGKISCESTLGKGTRFIVSGVRFPIASQTEISTFFQSPEATKLPPGVHVLVAEDNAVNQQVLQRLFSKCQVRYTMVSNGKEAVEIWKQNPREFSMIFMDLQMPVKDGFEAASEIRDFEKDMQFRNSVPIVALTASTYPIELQKAMRSGMNEYLIKPVNHWNLSEVITRMIALPSSKSNLNTKFKVVATKDRDVPPGASPPLEIKKRT